MKVGLATLLTFAVLATGFAAAQDTQVRRDDLIGRKFVLIVANGQPAHFDRQPEIEFGGDRELEVFGQICNRFRGIGELAGNRLTVGQAVSTRMLCLNEGLGRLESTFLTMLGDGADITLSGNVLTLSRDSVWLVFREDGGQAAAPAPAPGEAVVPTAPASSVESAITADGLAGKSFLLKSVDGRPFTAERVPHVEFGPDLSISGAICNSFRGPGSLKDGIFTSQVASTMMLCPDQALNQLESRFHQMLRDGTALHLSGDTLTLWNAGVTLVFEAR